MATRPRQQVNGRIRPAPVSHAKVDTDDDAASDTDTSINAADDIPAGPSPVDSLTEMMNGLQGATSARITVYRVIKNQKPSYVFECDPSTFSLDDLRDKYNGGEFRLYIVKDGRLWRNMSVVVEPKQTVAHDPAPPMSQMADVMAVMRDGFAAQAAALREALSSRGPSMFSGMDLPAVITAAAAAITALRPPPAPPAPPAPDVSEKALDMFMRGLEIANTMRDSGGSDNSLGGMLRDVLRSPILATAVQSAAQQALLPAPQRPPQQPAPTPNPVSHAKPPETVAAPQPKPEEAMLAYYLGFLCGKAQTGAEPSLYAELVLDNVPDEQLMPMLNRGDQLIDDLIVIHPPVAQHREWFVGLLKEINELLAPEDDASQTGDGNAVDTATVVVPGHVAQ